MASVAPERLQRNISLIPFIIHGRITCAARRYTNKCPFGKPPGIKFKIKLMAYATLAVSLYPALDFPPLSISPILSTYGLPPPLTHRQAVLTPTRHHRHIYSYTPILNTRRGCLIDY